MNTDQARDFAAGLSCWTSPVEPRALAGGTTNTNFVLEDNGKTFVVRIGEDIPIHGIVRSYELAACRAANAAGISPKIVHHEPGALVMDFIQAKTLTKQDIHEPETLRRIVSLLRRCHRDLAAHLKGPSLMFWVFQVNRQYLATIAAQPCRVSETHGEVRLEVRSL